MYSFLCITQKSVYPDDGLLKRSKTMLRSIFGPKMHEVTREWRKVHNEELSDLYSLPNIVQVYNREE